MKSPGHMYREEEIEQYNVSLVRCSGGIILSRQWSMSLLRVGGWEGGLKDIDKHCLHVESLSQATRLTIACLIFESS